MATKIKLVTVAGTRPEIIKLAKLVPLLARSFDHKYVFTDQHFSANMREVFFKDFHFNPDRALGVHSSEYDSLSRAVYHCFETERPSHVIVYGDTNSTVGATVAAKRIGARVIHIESGLRSFDSEMPEERNRVFVDHNSDFLLAPTGLNKMFLEMEGCKVIQVTGNLVVDVCLESIPAALSRQTINKVGIKSPFLLATVHRQENVDDMEKLRVILNRLGSLSDTIIFPAHPRTQLQIANSSLPIPGNVKIIQPLDYLDFLNLLYHCEVVLTDSGGVQEEAVTLGKPCITLRRNTERWETILVGANELFSPWSNRRSLAAVVEKMKSKAIEIRNVSNPYGERGVTKRAFDAIQRLVLGNEKPILLARNS